MIYQSFPLQGSPSIYEVLLTISQNTEFMYHNIAKKYCNIIWRPYHPALHLRIAFFISVFVTVLQKTNPTGILPQHSAFIIIHHHHWFLYVLVFQFLEDITLVTGVSMRRWLGSGLCQANWKKWAQYCRVRKVRVKDSWVKSTCKLFLKSIAW